MKSNSANNNSYLGNKGYTLYKSDILPSVQQKIKKDLMIKPYVSQGETTIFPVYRESTNKLYIPRYYGNKEFGLPMQTNIDEGENIEATFNGTLREKQQLVVDTYVNTVTAENTETEGGLLELPCAFGKCLGFDTEILMYNGEIKKVQNIRQNDLIMGDDSTPRLVKSICRGKEQMYKVINKQEDTHYICNESHILSLIHSETKVITDISVEEYIKLPKRIQKEYKGYKVPVKFYTKDTSPSFAHLYGFRLCHQASTLWFNLNVKGSNENQSRGLFQPVDFSLKNKYKCGSISTRIYLLAGIVDAIGTLTPTSITFHNLPMELLNDLQFVARSLGFLCRTKDQENQKIVEIYGETNKTELLPYIAKKSALKFETYSDLSYEIIVEEDGKGEGDYYGFEIDGNRRFVLGDFTVTHNTVLAINIISRLSKKTLIIVHKEFLMNQWIERIQQFLPSAKIGRIQGQVIDVDGKDIVIGMLQSLAMKEYPQSLFSTFGFTVIDEVHHISSQVFSKSLFKIVTKYMLGLSATMNRKDGTTHVFKMFLGDVIFKGGRDEEREVVVRAIEYKSHDAEFEETKLDFRGKPAYSTMIKNICEYNSRTEFILRIVCDMLKENSKQQIMILAHNRNILTYFHDAIIHREIATAGYYLGGMKEKILKETESKQIVIATYAMAAEALDIKTLTTLIMATPKTDVEQSIGRILREKHSNPIVVDIIDTHTIFKNQWRKRKTFYKKQKYKMLFIDSDKYKESNDITNWATIETTKKQSKMKDFTVDIDVDEINDEQNQKEIGRCLIKLKKPVPVN